MPSTGATNARLATQASPYLRGAAHQPVLWYPWGDDAFEHARREDKPLLLDVGAVWCHWCHVMDGESYDDVETARIINERFVPVKVDRDERPDVDVRYQKLVGAITGQGGWPLTAFLTPDGEVFYGGTYFPPTPAHGRPSFRDVLVAVADAYRDRRADVRAQADAIAQAVAHRHHHERTAGRLDATWVRAALDGLREQHDPVNGGWGNAPKFPHPSGVEALLAAWEREDREEDRSVVVATLDGMARGGVHDHVGGGFHRYGVDAGWHVPHFEKMLYDNAELLRNYVHAFRLWGRDEDRRVVEGIVRFLGEVLADSQGGFRGSQDADVTFGDDGDYFTWTRDELHRAVGDEGVARTLVDRFGVTEQGPMHHDRAKNVLHVVATVDEVARKQGRSAKDVLADLERGLRSLAAARAARKAPFVDPVLYANWNAMAIRAYLEASSILGRPDLAAFALRTLDRFLRDGYDAAYGFRHTLAPGSVQGLLDDNAQMLAALCTAFVHSQEASYLARAREVASLLRTRFHDPDRGGFHDVAAQARASAKVGVLRRPERSLQDAPSPSGASRAHEGLLQLADLTGDQDLRGFVAKDLQLLVPEIQELGLFGAALLLPAMRVVDPAPKVVVAGPETDPQVEALRRDALRVLPLGGTVALARGGTTVAGLAPEAAAFAAGPARRRAGAMVCLGTRCLTPVHDGDALRAALRAR